MDGRLSAVVGALVGLVLGAALLVPDADPDALAAQAMRNGLADELPDDDLAPDAWADVAPPGERPFLVELAELARAGEGRAAVEEVHLAALGETAPERWTPVRRAFSTRLSELDQRLRTAGRPGLRLAPEGAPTRAGDLVVLLGVGDLEGEVSTTLAAGRAAGPAGLAAGDPSVVTRVDLRAAVPGRTALLPPLVAILVALVFRKVLLALFTGILVGAVLLARGDGLGWLAALGQGFVDVFADLFWQQLVDTFRIEIIGFVLLLVAMVGVMGRSGGVTGLIHLLLGFARTVRSTLLVTWGMGLLIFFDDYANCLLVGNTMRPLTDRLCVSREKLAYIVDSTAAPVAGVSLLSTWIAYEVSTFSAHLPAAGIQQDAYEIFLRTIPFRFYCLFTLMFVLLTILTRRDYGPMRRAEERARTTGALVRPGGTPMVSDEATRIEPREGMPEVWWHGALPIALVLVATIASIFLEGGGMEVLAEHPGSLLTLRGVDGAKGITDILFDGSGGKPIFLGAFAGYVLAMFLTGSNTTRAAMVGGVVAGQVLQGPVGRVLGEVAGSLGPLGELVTGAQDYLAYALAFVLGAAVIGWGARSLPAVATTRREHLPAGELRRASLSSVRALFFAVLILFQAWMIGEVCGRMGTADYLVALLSGSVTAVMLPVLLFGAACLVAFATGSSWSTMAILLPNVVALAASVGEAEGVGALAMVVLCVGAVLEGSIFGDHCSPISDTTVLSSVSSASDHVDHVRTQAPYALTTGALAIGLGYVPTVALDWWSTPLAIGSALVVMLLVLFVFGRTAPDVPEGSEAAV